MRSATDSYEEDNEYLGSIHVWVENEGEGDFLTRRRLKP